MKILLHPSDHIIEFSEFLDFNCIEYTSTDIWNNSVDEHWLPSNVCCSLFAMDNFVFSDILDCDQSYNKLLEFITENKIWVISKHDCTMKLSEIKQKIHQLDQLAPRGSITFFHECKLSDNSYFFNLKNIKNKEFFINWHFHIPRIYGSSTNKNNTCKDFLLTMIQKQSAKHRDVLWSELNKKSYLLDYGITSFKSNKNEWIGDTPIQHGWTDGYPSMDLYNNCWLEIVPETFFREDHFTTEKTIKPISTRTPFLICSTPGYLEYLNNLGFKTFNKLIDESYDKITDLETRCSRIVKTLESIIGNGSKEFYNASSDILEHNFARLCEISGGRQHYLDMFFYNCLEEVDFG